MKELREILGIAETITEPMALATVVSTQGSSYRRPGARMLMTQNGIVAGMVSGGCLDADVLEHARMVIATGKARLVTYDTRRDDDTLLGIGTGCAGLIEIFVERVERDHAALTLPASWLGSREPAVLATVLTTSDAARVGERWFVGDCAEARPSPPSPLVPGAGLRAGAASSAPTGGRRDREKRIPLLAEGGARGGSSSARAPSRLGRGLGGGFGARVGAGSIAQAAREALAASVSVTRTLTSGDETLRVFLEVLQPPLSLVLCGAGPDAAPLVRLGKELGWQVTVADHRPAYATAARFPLADAVIAAHPDALEERLTLDDRTAVVVMTHHYQLDSALLAQFLGAPVAYLGLLGSRQRTERIVGDLRERDQITPAQLQRLHAPIGLDLGAATPEEIALSIVAEIQAVTSRRSHERVRSERLSPDAAQAPPVSPWGGPRTCAIVG